MFVLKEILIFSQNVTFKKKKKLRYWVKSTWLTEELKIQRDKLNAIYKRLLKIADNIDISIRYKKERALYKRNIKNISG